MEGRAGCLLDRSGHSLGLPVDPRMVGLGETMLDAVVLAGPSDDVADRWARDALVPIDEVHALEGRNCADREDRPAKNAPPVQRPSVAVVDCIARITRQAGLAASANAYQEVGFSDEAQAHPDRLESECDAVVYTDESLRAMKPRAPHRCSATLRCSLSPACAAAPGRRCVAALSRRKWWTH